MIPIAVISIITASRSQFSLIQYFQPLNFDLDFFCQIVFLELLTICFFQQKKRPKYESLKLFTYCRLYEVERQLFIHY